MPRPAEPRTPVTEADVIAQLSRSRKPQSLREIAAALDLRHSARRALVKLARRMKKRGDIHEYPNGRIGLPKEKQGADRSAERSAERGAEIAAPPRKGLPQRHGAQPQGKPATGPRPEVNQLTGRLVAHRDGYGFAVPDTPRTDMDRAPFVMAGGAREGASFGFPNARKTRSSGCSGTACAATRSRRTNRGCCR